MFVPGTMVEANIPDVGSPAKRRFLRSMLLGGIYAGSAGFNIGFAQTATTNAASTTGALALGGASRTALGAAMLRAAHQLFDNPKIFDDPFALRIVGSESESQLRTNPSLWGSRGLRASVVLRSRYAEDALERAFAAGIRQYVILGAGLDTFAYRNPHGASLRVFEVDHPATQSWKRLRLEEAGISVPDSLMFAPVDFEKQTLSDGLKQAGFNALEPAFFSLLGVTIYVTKPALKETFRFVASLRAGSEIVFDYSIPSSQLTATQRQGREAMAKRVAAIGEPWITYYDPRELQVDLREMGFSGVEDVGPQEMNARYFGNRADGLGISGGGHLLRASV